MWLLAHAAAGAALSRWIANLWWLAVAALASHVLLDWIPHRDGPENHLLLHVADATAAAVLIAALWRPDLRTRWGVFRATIPDLEVAPAAYGLMRPVFPSHQPWFPHGEADMLPGAAIQVLTVALCLWLNRRGPYQPGAHR